jgi:DNA-binding transcriptional LysR family regulator
MELRHLRYFVAVADELHFGRAATKLHISQPPLSHQIRDLEREVGVDLFHRNRRFVALTDAGRAFLEKARGVLADADQAVAAARRVGRGDVGRLAIGFGPFLAAGVLGKIVNAFVSSHAHVKLEFRTLHTLEQMDALIGGKIDVAFPILPVSHRDIEAEAIVAEPLVAALPSNHRHARERDLVLSQIRSETFVGIAPAAAPTLNEKILSACADVGFSPSVEHQADHVLAVLGLVSAGLGVAILPAWIGARPTEGVSFRSLRDVPPIQIGVAYRRRDRSSLLPVFLQTVRAATRLRAVRPLRASARA